jgi:hypothetical protein
MIGLGLLSLLRREARRIREDFGQKCPSTILRVKR